MTGRATSAGESLVGRDRELEWLTAVTDRAGSVVVSGPAGIGKSRLVVALAERRTGPVAWGRAWEASTTATFLPWQQLGAGLVRLADPATMGLTFATALGATFPHLARSGRPSSEIVAIAWQEYLEALVERTGTRPLLILEDVHRADGESVRVLQALAGPGLPCPLVATMRPADDEDAPTATALAEIARGSEVLHLRGLDVEAATALVRELAPAAEGVGAAVAIASGVPLHLRELAAALDAGETVHGLPQLVVRRLGRLSPEERRTIEAACVVGDEAEDELVATVRGIEMLTAIEHLHAGVGQGLLRTLDVPGRFAFAHDAYRTVIADEIGATELAAFHAAALRHARRSTAPPSPTSATSIADHALAARPLVGDQEALEATTAAGAALLEAGATESAHRYLETAARLAAAVEDRPMGRRVRLLLGEARVRMHRDDAHALLDEVLEAATAENDRHLLVAVGRASIPPVSPQALGAEPDLRTIRRLRTVHEHLPAGDPTRGRIAGALAIVDFTAEGAERLDERVAEAERTAETHADHRLAAWAAVGDLGGRRRPDVGPADLDRIDAHLAQLDDDFSEEYLSLLVVRVSLLWRLGRFEDVKDLLQLLEGFGDRIPGLVSWVLLRWRTTLAVLEGAYGQAEVLLVRGYDAGVAAGRADDAGRYFGLQAALLARDRFDDAADLVADWLRSHPGSPLVQTLGAWALADHGDDTEALRLVESAAARLIATPHIPQYNPGLMAAMLVAGWNADAGLCHELLDASEPYWDEWVVLGSGLMVFGPASLCAAVAASGAGDDDLATRLFDDAARRARDAGSPPSHAHVALERARHLRRRRHPRAGEWFAQAADEFGALGLRRRAEQCRLAASRPDCSGRFDDRSGEEVPVVVVSDGAGPPSGPVTAELRRQGRVWAATFAGDTALVPHRKGMTALAELLAHPDTPVPSLHLASVIDGHRPDVTAGVSAPEAPIADARAIREYRDRARELAADVESARARGDDDRVLEIREELEAIEEHLRTVTRPGGASRTFPSDRERARSRITKLVRTTIDALDEHLPAMADHLRRSVSTGSACEYRADRWRPVHWTIER
ncbi:MAG: AAA family ATPase [Acidimicrobiales bacterium]|nr:AAA family ATPase [Acidimicrobiales bacterium]